MMGMYLLTLLCGTSNEAVHPACLLADAAGLTNLCELPMSAAINFSRGCRFKERMLDQSYRMSAYTSKTGDLHLYLGTTA